MRKKLVRYAAAGEAEGATNGQDQALEVAKAIISRAVEGVPSLRLTSCKKLAETYLSDSRYADHDARVDSLIRWESAKNFTSGFLSGLGGVLTLPVSIPATIGASYVLQARMSGAIAYIYGYDVDDERVRTLVLLTLIGDSAKEPLKQAGIKIGQALTKNLIQKIPGELLVQINKKVGFRLLTKAGTKGVINLTKAVPVVGGVVGGATDFLACKAVGRVAKELFRPK